MSQIIEVAQAEAIEELVPLLGQRNACQATGTPQANWYRKNRQSPAPTRPVTPRKPHPSALSKAERDHIRTVLNE